MSYKSQPQEEQMSTMSSSQDEPNFPHRETESANEEVLPEPLQSESGETSSTSPDENDEKTPARNPRKRKLKEDRSDYTIAEEFLKVCYNISPCLNQNKSIFVAISEQRNYVPIVALNQNVKKIVFNEKAWESFNKYLHLLECYLTNQVNGKKTCIGLDDSDIEVENIKMRGEQCVKFRDLTKHDEKIILSPDEFEMLVSVVPAINRYIQQLTLALPMIRDYLNGTMESNTPLLYGPVDTSIYNRLPQEVFVFRCMLAKKRKVNQDEATFTSKDAYKEIQYLSNTNEPSTQMN